MRKLEDMEWWPELVKQKDSYSLRELAEMFGATPGAINNALKRNGIKREHAPPGPRSRRNRPAAAAAAAVAQAAPKSRGNVAEKLAPYADLLGTVPDSEIAGLSGLSSRSVADYRRSQGIRAAKKRKNADAKAEARIALIKQSRSKVAAFAEDLGVVSDAIIAEKAGVTVNAVRNFRNRHGISAPPRSTVPAETSAQAAPPAPEPEIETPAVEEVAAPAPEPQEAPAPEPVATSFGGKFAYSVTFGDNRGIVVGADLVEAATKAVAVGEVKAIELLGRILS